MGKKQRLKKEKKIQEVKQEKQAAELRYKEIMKPTYKLIKKTFVTCFITIIILAIGVQVNDRLPEIAKRLIGGE